jgi:hypothetical protein
MTKQNDFHNALKQLSKDIRVLIDLSMHETDESWEKMIEIVKKEISMRRILLAWRKKGPERSSARPLFRKYMITWEC